MNSNDWRLNPGSPSSESFNTALRCGDLELSDLIHRRACAAIAAFRNGNMMLKGTVKFFNASKGFGFITPDEGGKDVFVPAMSLAEAGISDIKPGQRISFAAAPHAKGPKAINLVLLIDAKAAAAPKVSSAPARSPSADRMTFYHDPNSDGSVAALAELRGAGHQPHVVDYLVNPPSRDELKRLSAALRRNSQSLIRRYDPLFSELRLDDRFLSDDEFWDAVIEHPSLINGPLVATATGAALCASPAAVHAFLDGMAQGTCAAPKPKTLSESALRFLRGETRQFASTGKPVTHLASPSMGDTPQDKVATPTKTIVEAKKKAKTSTKTQANTKPTAKSKKAKVAPKLAEKVRRTQRR